MKKRRILRTLAIAFVFALGFATFNPGAGLAESVEPITLNYVSYVTLAHETAFKFFKQEFIDKINEAAKGKLFIKVRGGPEVIREVDLGVSLQKGNIDMANIPTAFLESLVPAADLTKLSDYTAWEERENGIYEYIKDMYKKAGLFYLGRGQATEPKYFVMYLNKLVQKPADFVGLKLGGTSAFHGWYQKLGAVPVSLSMPDLFSSLDRGLVDGLSTSIYLGATLGLYDVAKYIVRDGVYICTVSTLINLDTWNRIPTHLQKLLGETMAEFEKKYTPWDAAKRDAAFKKAEAAGSKIITFQPDMDEWFRKCAEEGAVEYAEKRFPKDLVRELMERIKK
jgi:TRAP-type C4-dicarboxylate transport system substrate-binding protein